VELLFVCLSSVSESPVYVGMSKTDLLLVYNNHKNIVINLYLSQELRFIKNNEFAAVFVNPFIKYIGFFLQNFGQCAAPSGKRNL